MSHKYDRKGNYCMALLSIMLVIAIFSILSANASALGVAPSRKIIDYSDSPQTITARIINNENKDMKVVIYASGELADYVTLGKNVFYLNSSQSEMPFTYTIDMPKDMHPGTNNLSIIVIEVPVNLEVPDSSQTTIISTVSVTHQLMIEVPYPGLYAEGFMFVSDGDVNSTITFTANVINKGSDTISKTTGEVVIKGPTNEEIARIPATSIDNLASKTSDKMIANWMADVNPGVYTAEFVVNYDNKQFVLRKSFVIGNYYVDITDLKVNNFRLGSIAKFDVSLINKWNQPIQNVYGELQIMDQRGSILSTFKTNPADLMQLSTSTISGYWDTKDVQVGNYDVKVIVHYADKMSEKTFKTIVGIDSINVQDFSAIGNVVGTKGEGSSINILFVLVIISLVLNIGLFIYFKYLRKKSPPV